MDFDLKDMSVSFCAFGSFLPTLLFTRRKSIPTPAFLRLVPFAIAPDDMNSQLRNHKQLSRTKPRCTIAACGDFDQLDVIRLSGAVRYVLGRVASASGQDQGVAEALRVVSRADEEPTGNC